MIVTKFVNLKVNGNNIEYLKSNGYKDLNFGSEVEVNVEHLSKGSHVKIKAKCDVCGNIRDNLMYKEYLRNLKSGGYYSCKGKCSSDKNRKTNLDRYGVDNPSKSAIFKIKKSETTFSKYGVDSYFKTEEFLIRFKNKMIEKYGVDNPSKLEIFKEKRKFTMNDRHGVDYYVTHEEFLEKSKETFIKNYGVDHVMKLRDEVRKRLNKQGLDFETDEYKIYRLEVDKLTRRNKKELLEKWDGYDYYDGEYIKENFNLVGQHGDYPTIDHKTSVHFGFYNKIDASEIASIDNLCITKRRINSKKYNKIDFTL